MGNELRGRVMFMVYGLPGEAVGVVEEPCHRAGALQRMRFQVRPRKVGPCQSSQSRILA